MDTNRYQQDSKRKKEDKEMTKMNIRCIRDRPSQHAIHCQIMI